MVNRKKSMLMQVCGALLLALTLTSLVLSCLFAPLLVLVAAVFAGGFYFVYLYSNLEYEYSYFDGEVRFAKVMNKSRRKELKGYTMDEVVQIAPAGAREVMKYEMDKNVKKKDYSSRYDRPSYDMVIRPAEGNGMILVRFEPDDRYLDAVSVKYGQKVIRQ